MEPNTIIAAFIGGTVILAIPSLLVALAMRKLNKDDQADKDAKATKETQDRHARAAEIEAQRQRDQQIHESFAAASAELRDERTKREHLVEDFHRLELGLKEFITRTEIEALYRSMGDLRKEFKDDLGALNTALSSLGGQVIQALSKNQKP